MILFSTASVCAIFLTNGADLSADIMFNLKRRNLRRFFYERFSKKIAFATSTAIKLATLTPITSHKKKLSSG